MKDKLWLLKVNAGKNAPRKNCERLSKSTMIFLFKTAALIMVIVFIIPVGLYPNRNDIQFGHISVEAGLSQNAVNCIFQDSKGFMWFGTKDGLNKYDGHSFGIYHHDPFDPNTLSYNWVSCISEDRKGNLWIGTEKGINRYNRQTEQFTRFIHNPDIPQSLGNNIINSIIADKEGAIWIGTNGGLDRFDPATETFTHFRHNLIDSKSLSGNIVLTIYEDKSSVIWIGTNQGLDYFDKETEQFTHIIPNSNNPPRRINGIYEDSKSNLLIIYGNKLHQFEPNTQSFIPYKFELLAPKERVPGDVTSISEDSHGRLWIGTWQGVYIFDKQNNQFIRCQKSPTDPHSLSDDAVRCVYTDGNGGLWIGTNGGGINKWNPTLRKFKHYKHEPYNPLSLRVASIRTFYVDQDKHLWIGGYTGLNKYDRKTGKSLRYYLKVPNDINSLSSSVIRVIYEDPHDPHRILWIGTEGGGLNKFDRVTETFKRYDFSNDGSKGLRGGMVFTIHGDKSGYLWIGSNRGLNKFSKPKEEFTFYIHNPDDPHSISHNSVSTIFEDKLDFLWIGTHGGGLNRFDRKTESFVHFMHNPKDPKSLSHDKVTSIYEDHGGTLWVGTDGGGLNRFDRDSETFVQYTKKHGLPNNVIYGILGDEEGNLWLSTNNGLSRFNPQEETFRNYDINDGLQSSEFNYNAYYKSKSGELFFGGINGFNVFYPKDIKDNPNIPPVVITDFQIFNKSVPVGEDEDSSSILTTSISETEKIQISYKDNVISFEYVALDYAAPEKNEYAYIMEGLENEWNYVGKRRYATYSKLPPGEYTFRVKGSNNDGVWNEEGASINIIISPPFWETWWFRIASIVAILAFSLGVYKVRTYSIRKRSEQLKEINIKLNEQISIRKKTEETIRERESLLRTIISVTKDAMIVIGKDGLITMFNPAAEITFGRTSKEMIGQPLDILMPEEYREKHHGYVKGYFDTGEPHNAIGKILELPALHSDGHIFLMEISLSSGSHGEKPFVIAAARNITERKKAEEALRMSERSLSEAQRISHLGNWDLDLVKNELRWSDEIYRIFGLKPQEFGANYEAFLDAVHPDDREFVDTSYTNSVKNNTPYDIIHRIVKPDGEVRYVHEKAEDIKDERGETIRSIGTVQDITERKQVEEQIKASLREKEVLLQEIHHRVKNNMQIISSLLKLQSRHIKDEQALETFMSTQNRVLSMAIIHDRLYRSKDFARVDFAEYALSLANHLFSVYGIDPSTTKLKTDIKDIFLNINTAIPCGLIINELVSNSLKHAFPDSKKGEIKIAMHPSNKNEIEMIISDNGVGLPKDIDIRKTESLGLHLVTILAEDQLHGKIKLDRTKGTSFQIKLRVKQ